jgi:twinkle protein
MAIWEAGYKNVVSVPNGASSFTWVDTCWEWLQEIDEFIIFGDNDEPGLKMIDELLIKLGKYKVKVVDHKCKDANELLYKEGSLAVIDAINKTIDQATRGIVKMSNVDYEPFSYEEGIPTGIMQLDKTLEDLKPQELSILVGRSGEGKSTIISQMICNSIDNQIPVFLYSGELSTRRVINWIYKQAIGKETKYLEPFKTKYNTKYIPTKQSYKALQKWAGDYFYTFDKTKDNIRKNQDDLFQVMELAVRRYGCKWLIIDNLMSAMEESAESINSDQSNFVQRCKDFAETFNVHVTLVVHPNKLKKKGEKIEKEDISGSNNIPNKADIIWSIEMQIAETKDCDSIIRLIKDREEGNYLEVKLMFDKQSKRLMEVENAKVLEKKYGWKKYYEKDWHEIAKEQQEEIEGCPF